jgi:mono/diheme cytochrome c family protein
MPRSTKLLLILVFVGASVACSTARNPAKGFRLAANGDPGRGKAAFLEFGCNTCHEVQGARMPRPTVQPVTLGGSVMAEPSDGYLVTAIINPAYHADRYPVANGPKAAYPRMPEYASRMTVQQLTDIVAYLQSRYALRPIPVPSEYP